MRRLKYTKFMSKNTKIIFSIILLGFFFRELSLVTIMPLFSGQDEARHYNTVQLINEPSGDWALVPESEKEKEKGNFETYSFSEEIRKTARLAQAKDISREYYEKKDFSDSSIGINEEEIMSQKNLAFNKYYPADAVEGTRLYHSIAATIEHIFEEESILLRFFSVRIFSIVLGTITIALVFFIAKNIGFSEKESLLISAIISFQPKLSLYFTNINYDALVITIFSAFTLAGILSIKNGLNWKNAGALLALATLGILTKGTGAVLFLALFALIMFRAMVYVRKKIDWKKINKDYLLATILLLSITTVAIVSYLTFFKGMLSFDFALFFEYLSDSLSKTSSSLENYWGNLDWSRNDYSEYFIRIIWIVEIISYIGIVLFIVNAKKFPSHIKKEHVLFLVFFIIALQMGIRFYDWRIFSRTGELELGTPGRYFLPVVVSHIMIIFSGLGIILKKRKRLENALVFGMIFMFLFFTHLILNSVIPRYYF